MSDLVERLRGRMPRRHQNKDVLTEAADRIEALEAALRGWQRAGDIAANEVNYLRNVLQEIAKQSLYTEMVEKYGKECADNADYEDAYQHIVNKARTALAPEQEK